MATINQLYLLADHIKLSLLERQRAQSLNLPNAEQQDSQISRSLGQFKSGLEALEKENQRLLNAGDAENAGASAESLSTLRKQLDDLTSQFHGFSAPGSSDTLTHANDPSLAGDFAHAQSTTSTPALSSSSSSSSSQPGSTQQQQPKKKILRTPSGSSTSPTTPTTNKTVRFRDNPPANNNDDEAELFGSARYSDNPAAAAAGAPGSGYTDTIANEDMNNVQIHAYHDQILRDQDQQLDALGESIGRQRELSMQIGNELDSHVQLLDEVDSTVDRHQGGLDRARRNIGKVVRGVGESKQMMAIVILIVTLVLLIIITK